MRKRRTIGERVMAWYYNPGNDSTELPVRIDREVRKVAKACFEAGRRYEEIVRTDNPMDPYPPHATQGIRDELTRLYGVRWGK